VVTEAVKTSRALALEASETQLGGQSLFQLRLADGLGLVFEGDDGGVDLQGFSRVKEFQGLGGHQALGLGRLVPAPLPALLHHFIQVVDVVGETLSRSLIAGSRSRAPRCR